MGWQEVFAAVFQAGNTVVINGEGLFMYNGPAGPNNLVFAVNPTTSSLSDGEGNTVPPGPGAFVFTPLMNSGKYFAYGLEFGGGIPNDALSYAANTVWTSASNSQTNWTGSAIIQSSLTSPNVLTILNPLHVAGTPVNPTIITTDSPNTMTLQNGWTSTGRHGQYLLMPDNTVELDFELNVGTVTNGTTVWQAPTGYIPGASVPGTQRFAQIVIAGATANQLDTPQWLLTTTGALQCAFVPTGATVIGGNFRYRIV